MICPDKLKKIIDRYLFGAFEIQKDSHTILIRNWLLGDIGTYLFQREQADKNFRKCGYEKEIRKMRGMLADAFCVLSALYGNMPDGVEVEMTNWTNEYRKWRSKIK